VFAGRVWDNKAREVDIRFGVAVSVECDVWPQQALERLTAIIGAPTVVVASGGLWTAPSGTVEPKLHLHWRLAKPTDNTEQHVRLKRARTLACSLAKGDGTAKPSVHPLRWPGSWHRKAEPKLCRISECNPDVEIDLDEALTALEAAATAAGIKVEDAKPEAEIWTMPDGSTVSSLEFPCMAAPPIVTEASEEVLEALKDCVPQDWVSKPLEPSLKGLRAVKRIFSKLNGLGTPNSGDIGRHIGLFSASMQLNRLVLEAEITQEFACKVWERAVKNIYNNGGRREDGTPSRIYTKEDIKKRWDDGFKAARGIKR
jgi:hypothetical protein